MLVNPDLKRRLQLLGAATGPLPDAPTATLPNGMGGGMGALDPARWAGSGYQPGTSTPHHSAMVRTPAPDLQARLQRVQPQPTLQRSTGPLPGISPKAPQLRPKAAPAPMAPAAAAPAAQSFGAQDTGLASPTPAATKTGAAPAPQATQASPSGSSQPQQGAQDYENFQNWFDPNSPLGGSRRMIHRLRQLQTQLARLGYPHLVQQLGVLAEQANTDHFSPEERASFLAPYMERLSEDQQRAEGSLNRSLAERGLTDSSFGAAATGGLAAQGAGFRSDLVNRLHAQEQQRQLMAQMQFREFLQSLINGGTQNAASLQNQLAQQQLARQQMQQQGAFDLGGLLQGGMGMFNFNLPFGGGGGGNSPS